nr:hypothetical protein [Clostridia bacterium]
MKLSSLRELFFSLPGPLQRVLAFWLLSALISAILLVACLIFTPGIRLAIPPLISMVYSLFAGSVLFSDWANGNCICLQGTCSAIEKTLFRRRTAAMYVSLEGRIIMIRPTFPVPSVHTGDTVAIYLSRHFPVYERDGVQVIPRYYALSVTPDLSVVEGQNA